MEYCCSPTTKIQRNKIRLVVFNEQDQRLLYDSETVVCVSDRLCGNAKLSRCGRFQFLRRQQDISTLGSLVFGTLSTEIKKGSIKIHTVGSSLVLSRVFSIPKEVKLTNTLDSSFPTTFSDFDSNSQYHATIRSLDAIYRDDQSCRGAIITGRLKNSMEPPKSFSRVRNSSLQLDGILFDELRPFSPNRLSRARRKQMSWKGLDDDNGISYAYIGSRSRICSSSSSFMECDDSQQIGFALVFSMEEKDFIFQHILQIEEEIANLELGVHVAILTKRLFLQSIYSAYVKFCDSICLLHNAKRLKTPVWLSLMDPNIQTETAQQFCNKLADLIERLDHRETNFFMSTLLSAVLTNHLAWVASVAPPDNVSETNNRSLLIGTNTIDSTRHPYNANMAQFMEICGSVGLGCRLAKIVIVGLDAQLISQILFVLSYFIRCSNVEAKAPMNPSPAPQTSSSVHDDGLSPPLTDSIEDLIPIGNGETRPQPQIRTSTSFDEKRSHISLKRHSSSMSASSPPSCLVHSQTAAIFCSSNEFESNAVSDLDNSEPPQKTRVICAHEFRCLKQSGPIKLLMDVRDVRYTANDLITSTFSSSFPTQTFLSQQTNPTIALSPSTSSSSHTISSALSCPSTNELSRSLLAGVCTTYSPYFVLSGVQSSQSDQVTSLIYDDVKRNSTNRQSWCPHSTQPMNSFDHQSSHSHNSSTKIRQMINSKITSGSYSSNGPLCIESPSHNSNVDECLSAVVVIIGDLNQNSVRVVSASDSDSVDDQMVTTPCDAVISMLEQFLELHRMGSNSNFLISFLEDQLGGILSKSHTLVELVMSGDTSQTITEQLRQMHTFNKPSVTDVHFEASSPFDTQSSLVDSMISTQQEDSDDNQQLISMQKVSKVIGCDCSDLRLILNVATVYSPPVLLSVL